MTRHPSTEGNDLAPNRVDAQEDVTVPDGEGGRRSFKAFDAETQQQLDENLEKAKEAALRSSDGFAPGFAG